MADQIKFELVSPERLLMSAMADMIVVPGADGDFGVMAGHAPFISTIRPGIVEVHDGADVTRIFVKGGFADASPELLTVLAEQAVAVADIDLATLDGRIRDLAEDLSLARDEDSRARLQVAHDDAVAMRAAVSRAAA